MWLADGWKDYEVIDCSKGEKLERWGDYLLVRPDPQVIWDTPKKHKGWKKMNGHYHRCDGRTFGKIFGICLHEYGNGEQLFLPRNPMDTRRFIFPPCRSRLKAEKKFSLGFAKTSWDGET